MSKTSQITLGKSDSGLHAALHPLVLITISDYITRHTLRQQSSPIVGALLGQQNGDETTLEHAFECKVDWAGDEAVLDMQWFDLRLQQMKDVHKVPLLDLVGWWTTMPSDGPQQHHLPIQMRFNDLYPECSLLVGFHPTEVLGGSVGGKLPLTVYETFFDRSDIPTNQPDKAPQQIDTTVEDQPIAAGGRMSYKEIPYTVETGEAEMISVDFVARGGGNATAIETKAAPVTQSATVNTQKGKGKASTTELTPFEEVNLTSAEAEQIASLTAKANAIKMLRSRINLITTYLSQSSQHPTVQDSAILRSVQALLNRLALTVPANTDTFNQELLRENNDVSLVNLLNTLTESLKEASSLGKKSAVLEVANKGGDGTPFML